MSVSDRITQALEVLAEDPEAEGQTVRKQAEAMLGEAIDTEDEELITHIAFNATDRFLKLSAEDGEDPYQVVVTAETCLLLLGIGIGKRLGIEDGETFAKQIGLLNG